MREPEPEQQSIRKATVPAWAEPRMHVAGLPRRRELTAVSDASARRSHRPHVLTARRHARAVGRSEIRLDDATCRALASAYLSVGSRGDSALPAGRAAAAGHVKHR